MNARTKLLDAAKQLVWDRGVEATSPNMLLARSGVGQGSLYHHFGSKLDIVDAILTEFHDHVLTGYQAIVDKEPDPIERLRQMTRFAFSLIVDSPAAVLMVQNEAKYLSEQKRFDYLAKEERTVAGLWHAALEEGVGQGRIRSDVDLQMFYRFVRDAVAGSIRWFKPTKSKTIEDIADAVSDMLLHGILDPSARD